MKEGEEQHRSKIVHEETGEVSSAESGSRSTTRCLNVAKAGCNWKKRRAEPACLGLKTDRSAGSCRSVGLQLFTQRVSGVTLLESDSIYRAFHQPTQVVRSKTCGKRGRASVNDQCKLVTSVEGHNGEPDT